MKFEDFCVGYLQLFLICAALYPAQDSEELRGTLDAAALGCEMIADELCPPNDSGVQAEEEALQDATIRLRDAISALDRQQ